MEFHISRTSRDFYQFSETLFAYDGRVVFANLRAVRGFADAMNRKNKNDNPTGRTVQASQIYAMGLIDEIFHYIIQLYGQQVQPELFSTLLARLQDKIDQGPLEKTLHRFNTDFPVNPVYLGKIAVDEYLAGQEGTRSNRESTAEEMLLLWITNQNPACMRYADLFDDRDLADHSRYNTVIDEARTFIKELPSFGPEAVDLVSMLRRPAEVSPHSLTGQLEYIRNHWGYLIGDLLAKLLVTLDLIKEETKAQFGGGPGPAQVPDYSAIRQLIDLERERFSPDREWMPSLVLMAKNSYVWLDQLSKKYQRRISRLDEIPDQELDFLAYAGFTGLWLIGLWQRSKASERIKRLCGNPEAVASAYSIDSYRIADDLGGEEAFNNLRNRAWERGIRMASDMVPNHFGIDSPWVLYHPDYFLGLENSPFPSYSFSGENLSPDPAIGIFLEDHYYSREDAAVVFKREDFHSGSVRYLYHGNDGTVMPWNDTAQLNYLLPEVREAVMQIILDVARRTPIIRFDAAMTLAKKHIQRLWFPEPGSGGAIPTRAENGMSRADFDRLLPEEFWREVVDRVAREVPDTLLLAEAFWLMEGYFVRTLGMHRVYNSAFMHMLRNEDNANFRTLIKNTLEFDPEILKRYVNFMNNPDEKTAVEQFGSGDKYFGVCTVMATLPGLPMFGHGQLEGYSEKYGMEYRRAYLDEAVNEGLLAHHYQVIFPLLRQRERYSGSTHFRLFDFYTPEGKVNEDVLAYTNNHNGNRSLVIFHNRFADTQGWVRVSTPYLQKSEGNRLQSEGIGQALGASGQQDHFLIYREHPSNLMYIRDSAEVAQNGLFFNLHAYDHRVYHDFFEVAEGSGTHYREICNLLDGQGTLDLFAEIRRLKVRPLLSLMQKITAQEVVTALSGLLKKPTKRHLKLFMASLQAVLDQLETEFWHLESLPREGLPLRVRLEQLLSLLVRTLAYAPRSARTTRSKTRATTSTVLEALDRGGLDAVWVWLIVKALYQGHPAGADRIRSAINDWFLDSLFQGNPRMESLTQELRFLFLEEEGLFLQADARSLLEKRLALEGYSQALGVNHSGDAVWYNLEAMRAWLQAHRFHSAMDIQSIPGWDAGEKQEAILKLLARTDQIEASLAKSEYKLDRLLSLLAQP